jgi:hypothetical protein
MDGVVPGLSFLFGLFFRWVMKKQTKEKTVYRQPNPLNFLKLGMIMK